jgi:hypothetical protein
MRIFLCAAEKDRNKNARLSRKTSGYPESPFVHPPSLVGCGCGGQKRGDFLALFTREERDTQVGHHAALTPYDY